MPIDDEDDKPTVVLDLNALKKQALNDHEDLTSAGRNLHEMAAGDAIEFIVKADDIPEVEVATRRPRKFQVILFDFQSDFFTKNKDLLPIGFDYNIATTLPELNTAMGTKQFKILVFNYDAYAKAANQLAAQIKTKFPHVKILIMAKSISPEKARAHAQTPSGAHGYYQLPLVTSKIEAQFMRIFKGVKSKEDSI